MNAHVESDIAGDAMGGPPAVEGKWPRHARRAILGAAGVLTVWWVGFLGWSVVWLVKFLVSR